MEQDYYQTIEAMAEATVREKGSRFLASVYPVQDEVQIGELLGMLRKKYYDATHHCYAWRLAGDRYRVNDDGEPSGTAGRPIYGQLLSREVTNVLLVVVRYFGGTKLGVGRLTATYKESARAVLEQASIVVRTENAYTRTCFPYEAMNEAMKVLKGDEIQIVSQQFDSRCEVVWAVRRGRAEELVDRLAKVAGIRSEFLYYA